MTTFTTTITGADGGPTGIEVPEEVVLAFGRGKRLPVTVTLGGHTYRSTVGPYRGAYMIALSTENRVAAGVAGGDTVDVTIEPDDAPRTAEVPDDLAAALDAAGVRAAFDALSVSARKAHVAGVEGAKTEATRVRRVEKVVASLE